MAVRRTTVATAAGVLVLLLAAGLIGCLGGARDIEAMRLLSDLAAAGRGEAASAERGAVRYAVGGRARQADLYQPDGGGALLVLVPGATPAGKDDARVVASADALRRAGFSVLVPQLEAGPALRLGPGDSDAVADAIIHHARTGGGGGVVVVAVSYAVGPAMIAALDPAAAPLVRLVVAVGGYYDIVAALTYVTTGCARPGPGQPWACAPPQPRAKWQFALGNADRLPDPADRGRLAAIAALRLDGDDRGAERLVPGLGPGGRAVHDLLVNTDPDQVPALVERLPAALRGDVVALDLRRRDLSRLRARVILVHGQDDPVIPHHESVALAQALGGAELYLPGRMAHMALGPGFGDAALLRQAAAGLLDERDRALAQAAALR